MAKWMIPPDNVQCCGARCSPRSSMKRSPSGRRLLDLGTDAPLDKRSIAANFVSERGRERRSENDGRLLPQTDPVTGCDPASFIEAYLAEISRTGWRCCYALVCVAVIFISWTLHRFLPELWAWTSLPFSVARV